MASCCNIVRLYSSSQFPAESDRPRCWIFSACSHTDRNLEYTRRSAGRCICTCMHRQSSLGLEEHASWWQLSRRCTYCAPIRSLHTILPLKKKHKEKKCLTGSHTYKHTPSDMMPPEIRAFPVWKNIKGEHSMTHRATKVVSIDIHHTTEYNIQRSK